MLHKHHRKVQLTIVLEHRWNRLQAAQAWYFHRREQYKSPVHAMVLAAGKEWQYAVDKYARTYMKLREMA